MRSAVIALTLVATGGLIGHGTALLAGAGIELAPLVADRNAVPAVGPTAARPHDPDPILRSGLFVPGDDGATPPPVPPDDGAALAGCPETLRLVGTVLSAHGGLAAISGEGPAQVVRTGMRIQAHEVVEVEAHRVILRPSSGTSCELRMFSGRRVVEAVRLSADPEPAPRIASTRPDLGIRRDDDGTLLVPRALVRQATEAPLPELSRLRVVFPRAGDRTLGARIYGVRPGGVLDQLGLRSGDLLTRLNGFDLGSPDDLLAAFIALRDAEHLTLRMQRRGEGQIVDYRVVD